MKRTLEITASFTGKISVANYENLSPFFSAKETFEVDDSVNLVEIAPGVLEDRTINVDDIIKKRQSELQKICSDQFKLQADLAYQDKVEKSYQNIRFYDSGNGIKYPSVTSILNFDENFFVSADDLQQAGARGTVIHRQIEIYLKTGKWLEPKEIPDVAFEVMVVTKGALGLSFDNVNFVGFLKDFPITVIDLEKTVINHENKYAGRLDILCKIDSKNKGGWAKIDGIIFDEPLIMDIKTSSSLDKAKGYAQQSAYAKALGVNQIALLHLNKENVCGYSKPVVTQKVDSYFDIFLNKRELFKKRFGI